jgi:hypothetical protein
MEYNARSVAEAVLIVGLRDWVRVAGQHVIDFDWSNGKALGDFNIKSTASEHREGVLCPSNICGARYALELSANPFNLVSVCVAVGAAKEDFPKRSYFPDRIPKHGPKLIGEHIALSRDWSRQNDGIWGEPRKVIRASRDGEIGASVAHELAFNPKIFVEEVANTATASIEAAVFQVGQTGVKTQIRILAINFPFWRVVLRKRGRSVHQQSNPEQNDISNFHCLSPDFWFLRPMKTLPLASLDAPRTT